jgi:hypothetical protein
MDTDSSRYSAAAVMYGTKVHFVRFGKERLADGCDAVVDGHTDKNLRHLQNGTRSLSRVLVQSRVTCIFPPKNKLLLHTFQEAAIDRRGRI